MSTRCIDQSMLTTEEHENVHIGSAVVDHITHSTITYCYHRSLLSKKALFVPDGPYVINHTDVMQNSLL